MRHSLVIALLLSVVSCSSCSPGMKREGQKILDGVIDCTTEQALALTEELEPTFERVLGGATLGDGTLDRGILDEATKGLKQAAWCALENTAARMLARLRTFVPLMPTDGRPQSSPSVVLAEDMERAIAELRSRRFGASSARTLSDAP